MILAVKNGVFSPADIRICNNSKVVMIEPKIS